MAQLLMQDNIEVVYDSDDEMLANPDEVNNYKGMYQNDDDEYVQKYFEYGAHFSYRLLCEKLVELKQSLPLSRAEKEEDADCDMRNVRKSPDLTPNPADANNLFQSVQGINKEQHFRRIIGNSNDAIQKEVNKVSLSSQKNKGSNLNYGNNSRNTFQQKGSSAIQIKKKPVNIRDKVSVTNEENKLSFLSKDNSKAFDATLANNNNAMGMENYYFLGVHNNVKSRNVNNNIDGVYKAAATGNPVNNLNLNTEKESNANPNSNHHVLSVSKILTTNAQKTKVINLNNNNNNKISANTSNNLLEKNSTNTSRNVINLNINLNSHLTDAAHISTTVKQEDNKLNDGVNMLTSFTNDIINFHYQKTKNLGKAKNSEERGGFLKTSKGVPGNSVVKKSADIKINYKIMNSNVNGNANSNGIRLTDSHKVNLNNRSTLKENSQSQFLNTNPSNAVLQDLTKSPTTVTSKPISNNLVGIVNNNNNNTLNNNITANIIKASTSVISVLNSKQGRNITSGLNPNHNTTLDNKLKASSKKEIKKLNLDKLQNNSNKIDAYHLITSSVDNRTGLKNTNNVNNLNSEKVVILNVKKESSSPTIESNTEKENKSANVGFSDIISNICKNTESKSRNAQRNNLTSTKSNLFNSDKALSMQSASYQKCHIFTQTNVKTTTNIHMTNTNVKNTFKPKIGLAINKSITNYSNMINNANRSLIKSKPNTLSENKSKTNLTQTAKKTTTLKPSGYLNINPSLTKKMPTVSNMTKTGTTVITQSISNTHNKTNIEENQNKNILLAIKEKSPTKTKPITQNFIKVNSNCSQLKTKSNSATSNVSNSVIASNNNNHSLIKNYNCNKNATKISNVSYLNLKKNEYSVARNINMAPSDKNSKTFLNTLSSGSIVIDNNNNLRKSSHEAHEGHDAHDAHNAHGNQYAHYIHDANYRENADKY